MKLGGVPVCVCAVPFTKTTQPILQNQSPRPLLPPEGFFMLDKSVCNHVLCECLTATEVSENLENKYMGASQIRF